MTHYIKCVMVDVTRAYTVKAVLYVTRMNVRSPPGVEETSDPTRKNKSERCIFMLFFTLYSVLLVS